MKYYNLDHAFGGFYKYWLENENKLKILHFNYSKNRIIDFIELEKINEKKLKFKMISYNIDSDLLNKTWIIKRNKNIKERILNIKDCESEFIYKIRKNYVWLYLWIKDIFDKEKLWSFHYEFYNPFLQNIFLYNIK